MSSRLQLHEFTGHYSLSSLWARISALRRLVLTVKPDLVHLHTARSGFLGMLACAGMPIPIVYSGHSWRFEQKSRSVDRAVFRLLERHISLTADFVTFLTARDRDFGLSQGLVRADRSVAINTRITAPCTAGVIERRFGDQAELVASTPTVVNVGTLNARKNPLLFLDVAAKVLRQRRDVRFLWLGDGDLMATVKAEAARLGIDQSVHFPGSRSREEVDAELAAASVLLFTSTFEGVPLAILEAKLSGLPVVAGRYPGVDAVVHHGVDGLLFGLHEAELGAQHILNLLQRQDFQREFAEAGLQFALAEHSDPRIMAEQFADVYERLTHQKRDVEKR